MSYPKIESNLIDSGHAFCYYDLPAFSGHVAKVGEPKNGFREPIIILNGEPFTVAVKYTLRYIWPKK